MSDRKAGTSAVLGSLYGGSKTGHWELMGDYWEQAMSRVQRHDPPKYNGEPYFCIKCNKPCVSQAVAQGSPRCECRHDVRQRETAEAAMQRRAHWLLKREFDAPDVIHDWKTAQQVVIDKVWAEKAYKVDFAELEKRMSELYEHRTDAMLYGYHGVSSNKEKK